MGCLFEIIFTQKASEGEGSPFGDLLWRYRTFFRRCRIVEERKENEKCIIKIYVRHTENKTSDFLIERLSRDKKVEKSYIIS